MSDLKTAAMVIAGTTAVFYVISETLARYEQTQLRKEETTLLEVVEKIRHANRKQKASFPIFHGLTLTN
jgi:hypothetical protein